MLTPFATHSSTAGAREQTRQGCSQSTQVLSTTNAAEVNASFLNSGRALLAGATKGVLKPLALLLGLLQVVHWLVLHLLAQLSPLGGVPGQERLVIGARRLLDQRHLQGVGAEQP